MTDVARCQETIANYVLDGGEAISYRALASQVGGASTTRAQALAQFCQDNANGVGAVHVTVVKAASSTSKDPRSRVIRLSTSKPDTEAAIYGVFPVVKDNEEDERIQEAMVLAMWAQERKVRNDLFAGRSRHQPLSRELLAFYDSDVQCVEATSRTDMGDSKGEEAVSMFDSIKATSTGTRSQATSSASKSSFFKSSGTSTSTTTSSSSKSSSSFFKSSTNGTSAASKPKPTAVNTSAPAPTQTKRLDAESMNNVLSVDSDSDEDEDDGGAPKFVKTAPATKSRPTKRVMISDDEDEDMETSTPRPSTKRKLSESPERPAKQSKPASPQKNESPKRKREEEIYEIEAEEEPLPTGPIKRRELVNKTFVNDDGYMVTEKVYEEVEISVEQLEQERAAAKKKQAAAKAAAEAQKARAAATNSKSTKSTGPAKQKKLDFFFTRK